MNEIIIEPFRIKSVEPISINTKIKQSYFLIVFLMQFDLSDSYLKGKYE